MLFLVHFDDQSTAAKLAMVVFPGWAFLFIVLIWRFSPSSHDLFLSLPVSSWVLLFRLKNYFRPNRYLVSSLGALSPRDLSIRIPVINIKALQVQDNVFLFHYSWRMGCNVYVQQQTPLPHV